MLNELPKEVVKPLNTVQDSHSAVCLPPVDAATAVSLIGIGNSNNVKTDVITDPVNGSPEARSREGSMVQGTENRTWSEVKSQARALAVSIEGNSVNLGAYVKLIREYDARTILAAVIATLMRKHFADSRGPLRRPGGYFTRRCQEFQGNCIPADVATWVERCGHLSFQAIEEMLEAAARVHPRMDDHPLAHSQPEVPGAITTLIYPPTQGDWMSSSEANALAERICKEDPSVVIRQIQHVYLEAGEAYVIETVIDGVPYVFPSIGDWEDYRSRLLVIMGMDTSPVAEKGWKAWKA